MDNQLLHGAVTGKILGCAFEVHKVLGNGFREIVYQQALALELEKIGVAFQREIPQEIFYKSYEIPLGSQRVDFLVEDCVLIETKAVPELNDAHAAQLYNYLKLYEIEVGLLINFGGRSMAFKRLFRSL